MAALNPLNSTEIHKIFKIAGLPQQGAATVAQRLVSLFGPSQDPYGFSATVTSLNGILAVTSDDQNTTLRAVIAVWDNENLDVSDLEICMDAGTAGTVYSAEKRRQGCRRTIANVLGFHIPTGGFSDEVLAASPQRGPRLFR
jgi:hypothetical protein